MRENGTASSAPLDNIILKRMQVGNMLHKSTCRLSDELSGCLQMPALVLSCIMVTTRYAWDPPARIARCRACAVLAHAWGTCQVRLALWLIVHEGLICRASQR